MVILCVLIIRLTVTKDLPAKLQNVLDYYPPMLKYANKWTKNSFCSQMNTYHEFIRQTTILIILVWIGNGCGRICFRSTKC